MKALSLYIDKWYMVGSVIDGAISTPLSLSNGEERIWLYFWSNSTVNNVNYGQSYKDEALDGKTGYYADIFDLLPDYKEYSYEKYGEKKSIKKIFDDAGIFSDLKKSFGADHDIPVYLSFSDDIDIVSQHIFINLLSENNFIVKQYTESINSLTVDFLERKGSISHTQYVLVVNACNENLIYSICIKEKKRVMIIASRKINGYGIDCREQAIVEEVLEYLQDATRFLTNDPREKREELLYLSQNAQDWLRRLDEAPAYAPVALGNVHFKKQTRNDIPVTISPKRIIDRTKNIIEKLVTKAVDLLSENKISSSQISHLIFLGDIFGNKSFQDILNKKIGVEESQIITLSEQALADVVNVYEVFAPNYFEAEKEAHKNKAQSKYKKDQRKEIESKTKELKEKADIAESEDRLQDAIDFYERVLRIDAADRFSQAKKANLIEELKRREADKMRIDGLMLKASQSYDKGKYDDVVKYCKEILRIRRNNSEAISLKEKVLALIKRQQQLENYILKMNEFISSEEFHKARNILQKVDDNNFNDARLKDIRDNIENGIIKDTLRRASDLVRHHSYTQAINLISTALKYYPNNKQLNDRLDEYSKTRSLVKGRINIIKKQLSETEAKYDYSQAIELCHELIELDKEYRIEWHERLQYFKSLQEEKENLEKNFKRKIADINVLIRRCDSSAKKTLLNLQSQYHKFGIYKYDMTFSELLNTIINRDTGNEESQNNGKKGKETKVQSQTEGFILLKEGKFKEAKRLFATKEHNSEMSKVCSDLIYLSSALKKRTITSKEYSKLKELIDKYQINN